MNSHHHIRISAFFMSLLILSLPIIHAEELNLIYDKNGNLVTGDGLYRVYNGFNQLWKIYNGSDSSGMLLQELEHHPMEERVWIKKVYNESGNVTETTYYFSKEFVRVVNNSGTYDYLYVYHEGQLVAVRNPDGSKHFYHPDHLGSTTLITDESGDEVETTEYSPFGIILSGGDGNRYDYEGKEFDKITGAFDFHFRKYCAKWGKFCQPDTLIPNLFNPQNLNRYAFEKNNPYRYTDPNGRYERDVHFDLTYYFAVHAGFDSDEAHQVASANQGTDENEGTKPVSRKNYASGITKHYHFQPTNEAERRIEEATRNEDLEELGVALHTYQDSFSHEYSISRGRGDHILHGHHVDKTYNYPDRADRMAFGTFYHLARYQGMDNSQIINKWLDIQSSVTSFNRDKSSLKTTFLKKGGSVLIKKNGRAVGSRWGKEGRGTGNAYCKRNCG